MTSLRTHIVLAGALLLKTLAANADVRDARIALNQGRLDDAAAELRGALKVDPRDVLAHQTLCRVFYAEELLDDAISECESARADTGTDAVLASDNEMWLGRSYGMKASRTNPVSAFRLAKKVVAAFERAVELNPRNIAAISDLGEYYVDAPPIVGGGLDKADHLAEQIMPVSATKAHRIRAMAAEKHGDTTTAEAEFKAAFEAQRTPQTLLDLADFYRRRKQCDQALAAIRTVIRMDRAKDSTLVDAASVLVACDREPQLAQELLSNYLASSARSDSAPAPRVHTQLGDLFAKSGDLVSARREYEAALSLATNYAPARKALQSQ